MLSKQLAITRNDSPTSRKRFWQGSLSIGVELVQFVLPVELSFLSTRYGWELGPSWWNILGVPFLVVGPVLLVLAMREHLNRLRSLRTVSDTPPDFLIQTGPYRFTRNPMYVAEMTIWLGWTIFFASTLVLLGFAVLTVALVFGVPFEERGLQKQFGETYLEYKRVVPRWLIRRRWPNR
jgi:protein-S-isoprenylcysteine O-methyltransferase Ste14